MKKALTTLLLILVILAAITAASQPEIPANDCTVKNLELARLCLSHIPKYYSADQLSYLGHMKAWVYRWSDKLGISLGERQSGYLVKYSSLEDAVNCHLTAAGDASLNMTMAPTEFVARHDLIARDYALQP